MQNPFESGHIKNYLLLYASVVVIMVLFFIASTLFHEAKPIKTKTFATQQANTQPTDKTSEISKEQTEPNTKFKLLDKAY